MQIRVHAALADYFLGVWADGNKKPYKSRDGSIQFAERLVASQPVIFKADHDCSHEGQQFNLRKLSELPYHLVMSNDLEALKKESLCNYEFLLSQLRARGLSELMDNFTLALTKWPADKDLITVHETLQLSTNALSLWPGQLASQLMSRIQRDVIDNSECLRLLETKAKKPSLPALVPQMVSVIINAEFRAAVSRWESLLYGNLTNLRRCRTSRTPVLEHISFFTPTKIHIYQRLLLFHLLKIWKLN